MNKTQERKEIRNAFKLGVKAGIPIMLAYFAVSFTFGMMAKSVGISTFEAVLISLTNVTSAGQFAALNIIVSGGTLFELALNQFIINMRYMLMSFSISQKIDTKYSFAHRFLVAFGMTDEIFAVSAALPGKSSPYFHYGAMVVAIGGWVIGTLIGAIAGQILPAIVISALSIAIYGMFIAIILPPAKKNHVLIWVILAAMGLSAVFYYVPVINNISSGFAIIIVTVVVAAVAALLKPIKDDKDKKIEDSEEEAGHAD